MLETFWYHPETPCDGICERGIVPTKSEIVLAESKTVSVNSRIVLVESGTVRRSPEVFQNSGELIMSELILIMQINIDNN
jgi:hypothetical protein